MKIYLISGRRNHLMFVTPGTEQEATVEWKNPDGSNKQFTVRFVDGVADVPKNLGAFLIHKKMVRSSPPLILPAEAAVMAVQEERVRNHRILADNYHATGAI